MRYSEPSPIRILIIDDSSVIRKVLSDALASDPAIKVVGTAANGHIGLDKLSQVNPDLVTLDVEMPIMDGLETLGKIRIAYPKLPVIMFSTLTERGAATTLDALALGASDYVTKPGSTGSLDLTMQQIRDQLIPKVKALCRPRPLAPNPLALRATSRPEQTGTSEAFAPVEILAIGTSTGGPNALAEVIPVMPKDFPVPIVIVQHMPPVFTRLLAARLNDRSAIKVQEGRPGQVLIPGEAWIAPGDYHMTVERHGTTVQLCTDQNPPENSCRPAVDPLFRSVAKAYGPGVLSVVLTGMGSDGVNGAHFIREKGGLVLVQDEQSSVVWGMPGQVAEAGLADAVYPLSCMARELVRRVAATRTRSLASSSVASPHRYESRGSR